MKLYLLLISLFIFSCDLPNEADADCSGIHMGSAFIDECGRCVGENTGFTAGYDKDVCGECFGENDCARCNEIDAINYVDIDGTNFLPDNDMCVYDLCETIPSNVESSCNSSQVSYPYQIGEQLSCADVEESLGVCFPSNCVDNVTLSDFYGKVIWMEITSTWWATCYTHLPEADDLIKDYIDNPNFVALSVLMDEYQPHSCQAWGNHGNSKLPILINGGNSLNFGNQNGLESKFFSSTQIPKRVFIDHELKVYDLVVGYMSDAEIKFKINEMLELMED